MKGDDSNDSGLEDTVNGSITEENKQEPLVDAALGKAQSSCDQQSSGSPAAETPSKAEVNQENPSPTTSNESVISNVSIGSSPNFSVVEGTHRGSDTELKAGYEPRSLDQLSPVDYRALEQQQMHHCHVPSSQSYSNGMPSSQDFRPQHGYHHQSVIMPLISSYSSQPHLTEWQYQSSPPSSLNPNDWTLVTGHEGMFSSLVSMFCGCNNMSLR